MFTSGGNEIKSLREREKREIEEHVKYDRGKGAKDAASELKTGKASQRNYDRSFPQSLPRLLIAFRNRDLDSFTRSLFSHFI